MKTFRVVPQICQFDSCAEFAEEFQIGEGDVILTNPTYFERYFKDCTKGAYVLYARKYGSGEPSDKMVAQIAEELQTVDFRRVIAIGGGSIIDVSKLLVQKQILPLGDLYDKKIPTQKVKELVIVPTTCGTGSEVTSVSVIELTDRGTKMGLQTDEEFADYAVLIPELLEGLPDKVFATSSIDALIHAVESFLSPKATDFSEMYSGAAIRMILSGYRKIREEGIAARNTYMHDFLLASTYAGIAFGNAGCAAVHAMSMSFSGPHHVAHGESNYALFTEVLKMYRSLKPDGKLVQLTQMLQEVLGETESDIYDALDGLLAYLLPKKKLREYGVKEEELPVFVETVVNCQGRLTANNYTPLPPEVLLKIYQNVF